VKKFWKWTNEISDENKTRVLRIDGVIAEDSWFDDDVTPQIFREELFAEAGNVTLWINSPGGDCIAASQIYSMLKDYKGEITVKIDGTAASAASVIAMAGDKVLMSPTALMMIHNPATVAFGDHNDMQRAVKMLNEVKESIINAYELRSNLSRSKLSKLMEDETYMNAYKAIELGFADDIISDEIKSDTSKVPYAFSSRSINQAVANAIIKKCSHSEPKQRNVKDLRNSLEQIKKLI